MSETFDYYKQANEVLGKARKISRSQLKAFTIKLLKEQGGVCAVCKQPISLRTAGAKSDYCVDHCHVTGLVRGVLHRSCNAALGKMENAAGRWGAKSMSYSALIPWLENMLEYLKKPGTGLMYPDHKTAEEKAAITKQKATRAAAVRKARLKIRTQENA